MARRMLCHCFGIEGRGYRHERVRFEKRPGFFRIGQDLMARECPQCAGWDVAKKGTFFRGFQALPRVPAKMQGLREEDRCRGHGLSAAYICAVNAHFPDSPIVFNHFHLIKLFNEKLSQPRRGLSRKATDFFGKKVLKRTPRLFVNNPENLDPSGKQRKRLEEALSLKTVRYGLLHGGGPVALVGSA